MQAFDSILFVGQNYFFSDGVQLCLTFPPLCYTLKTLSNSENLISWKSKGLSTEKIPSSFITANSFSPTIKFHEDSKFCVIFKLSCLKQKKRNLIS